jgi:hypothetical protein
VFSNNSGSVRSGTDAGGGVDDTADTDEPWPVGSRTERQATRVAVRVRMMRATGATLDPWRPFAGLRWCARLSACLRLAVGMAAVPFGEPAYPNG